MTKRVRPRPSKTYVCWVDMRQRCNNPNGRQYKDYGGRGIRVCERWNSYANFLADMGEKPIGLSLERIDNEGDYAPENCRWATHIEQMRNQRVTRRVRIKGHWYIAADLADVSGLKTDTIMERAKHCKTLDEILSPKRRVFTQGLALGGIANGKRQQSKKFCIKGHAYDEANTYYTKEGWRRCRACQNEKQKARYARQRQET